MEVIHVNLTKEKYSFSELVEYHKCITFWLSHSRVDWGDFWSCKFKKLDKETLKVIFEYTKHYDMLPALVRVLFARYGCDFTDVLRMVLSAGLDDQYYVNIICCEGCIFIDTLICINTKRCRYAEDYLPISHSEIKIPWLHIDDLKPYPTIPSVIRSNGSPIYKVYID